MISLKEYLKLNSSYQADEKMIETLAGAFNGNLSEESACDILDDFSRLVTELGFTLYTKTQDVIEFLNNHNLP